MICRQCGATVEDKRRCDCIDLPDFKVQQEHITAFKDLLDYLDDRIAPALVTDSFSIIFDQGVYSLSDIAKYIIRWANAKQELDTTQMGDILNFALLSIHKLFEYRIINIVQAQTIIPRILISFYENIDPTEIEDLKRKTSWLNNKLVGPVKQEQILEHHSSISNDLTIFDDCRISLLENIETLDEKLSEGDTEIRSTLEQLISDIQTELKYEQFTKKIKDSKRLIVECINKGQLFAAWEIASTIVEIANSRNKEATYRIIYESVPATALNCDVLKSLTNEAIYQPLLKPIVQLFSEFSHSELFLALLHESDQAIRHLYYNLVKVYGEDAIPSILNELDYNQASPWYYIRNIISLLGDLSPFSEQLRKKSIEILCRYANNNQHRQVVISTLTSIAKISGNRAENALLGMLNQDYKLQENILSEDSITKQEFASKIIEALCILGSETSVKEVLDIVFGKKVAIADRQTVFASAVNSISRLDLSIYPILLKNTVTKVLQRIVDPPVTLKSLIFRREAKEDTEILKIFRHTRGTDPEAVLQSVLNSKASTDIKHTAQTILLQRNAEGIKPKDTE